MVYLKDVPVIGMLAFTVSLHGWICHSSPTTCFYGFADNWSLYGGDVSDLKVSIKNVEHFCDLMYLPLAGDKSWVWSASTTGRKSLQDVTLQGKHVPVRYHEKELGCDMQYTKRPCKRVFQKRMSTTISKLKKIPKIPVQNKFKKRLVKGSALPSCEYGSTVIHASKQDFSKLWTEVGKALGGGRAGESPYLTCIFGGKDNADPEFVCLIDKIRILRRLANRNWFSTSSFLSFAENPGDRPGPARSLHNALLNLGLHINVEGDITLHHGIAINVFHSNFDFLVCLLECEWTWVVSCRLSTKRKVWKPIYFNPRQFRYLETKYNEQKFQALLVHTNGAYYTHDHLSRFKTDHNDMCPWCEQHDSIVHRTNCQGLSEIRKKNFVDKDLSQYDDIFIHHGVHATPDEVWDLLYRLSLNQLVIPEKPPTDHTIVSLYIDGSCTDPSIQLVRLSSSAVTLVQGHYQSCVVKSQIVPGMEQSSSRGEIFAGILSLSVAFNVVIHTDYQLFHDRVQGFLQGHGVQTHWTNHDLWTIVWELIKDRCEHINIVKVKAHENWEILSGDRRMQAWHNHQVDLAAKKEIAQSPLFTKYQKVVKVLAKQKEIQDNYSSFLIDCAMDNFKNKTAKTHYREKFDLDNLVAKSQGNTRFTDIGLLDVISPSEIRFPVVFLRNIVNWFAMLTWGHSFGEGFDCVTWVELYVDFVLCTKSLAPVRLPSTNSKKAGKFVERTHNLGAHINPLLGADAFTFASAIKFLDRKKILDLPKLAPRVSMSSMLGLAEKYAGLDMRPNLTQGTFAASRLQKSIPHFCPARGNLNFVLNHIPTKQDHDDVS